MFRYDSTAETGYLSPVFDEVIFFCTGWFFVAGDAIESKVENMMKRQAGDGRAPNSEVLNRRTRAFKVKKKKNRPHPLMISKEESGESREWLELSSACSSGEFSINAIMK